MSPRRAAMTADEAARVLGVARGAAWAEVRVAYRDQIRSHHPDHAGESSSGRAARIIEAYRVLDHARIERDPGSPAPRARPVPPAPTDGGTDVSDLVGDSWRRHRHRPPEGLAPPVWRQGGDTLLLAAPADETFRWLLEAAHDIGEVTYVDGSVPIMEVLCRFEGEPATSLLLTLQGRAAGTEVFCTVESIEDRPAPPTESVVDLLELALHRRTHPETAG